MKTWLFSRSKLIQKVFKMKDDLASMQGVTQERAYELVTNDNIDDLLEEVLKGEWSSATLYVICLLARLHSSFCYLLNPTRKESVTFPGS